MNNLEFIELLISFKETLTPDQQATLIKLLNYLNSKKLLRDLGAYEKVQARLTNTAIKKLKEVSN